MSKSIFVLAAIDHSRKANARLAAWGLTAAQAGMRKPVHWGVAACFAAAWDEIAIFGHCLSCPSVLPRITDGGSR